MNFIDISTWQSAIDLDTIFKQNKSLDGIIIKASGGTGYVSPEFRKWANWLVANNKPFGIYHFLEDGCGRTSGQKEADHFIKTIEPYLGKAVLFVDWEATALNFGAQYAIDFMNRVKAVTGHKCGIYLSQSRISQAFKNNTDCPLWVAQYADNLDVHGFVDNPWYNGSTSPWEQPLVRQYTATGILNGYNGRLDFDKVYCTAEEWAALAAGHEPEPTPAPAPDQDTNARLYAAIELLQQAIDILRGTVK